MLRGVIYGASAAAIWGGMYVVSDVVLMTIPPFTLLLLRLLLGLISIGVVAMRANVHRPPREAYLPLFGIGLVGYGVSLGAQFIGTDLSTAVNGAIVTSATPAFVVIFAVWLLHEQLTLQRILSIVLATIGIIIIIDFSQASFSSGTFLGNIALAIAALTWGLYSVLVRWFTQQFPSVDTLMVTLVAFIGGMVLVIPASIIELTQRPVMVAEIDFNILLGVLFLGVISTAVAMWLWNTAFRLLDASIASLLFFVQPISGALLGWVFLGQVLTPTIWLGSMFILGGVLLSIVRVPKKAVSGQ